MKNLMYTAMLLLGLSITTSCFAQDSDYKWLYGEWKNAVYGDIAEIYPDNTIRFLKNGLVFSKEEEENWMWDYPKPETIDDLDEIFLSHDKFPFVIDKMYGSEDGGGVEVLVFDYLTGEYPFEPVSTTLEIDSERKQLRYYFYYTDSEGGEFVCLTKTSDLVNDAQLQNNEEQKQKEVAEKNKNLRNEIAEHEFDWMQGQWNLNNMVGMIAYLDDYGIMVQRGSFSETGAFEVERTQSEPIDLQYRINDFTKEVELVLEPFDIYVDKESHSLYTYYAFDQRIEFEKVSEEVPPIVVAASDDPKVASGKPKEENKQYKGNAREMNHKTIVPVVLCVLGAILLILAIVWMIRKSKVSAKKSLWQNKWVIIAVIAVVLLIPILVFVVHKASTKGLGNVVSTEEFIRNEEDGTEGKAILATLNDGTELGFLVLREAPSQVTLIHCEHEKIPASGQVNIPNQIESKGIIYAVTSIGDYAFENCTGLTSVTIPVNVSSIGDLAFDGCVNISKIVVEEGNSNFDSRNNCNAIIETASNTLITACCNTIIPKDVTGIANSAFFGCEGLTSVTISANVTSIGNGAFNGCQDLTKIVVEEGNRKYDSRGNCNAVIETASNTLVAACRNTTIPNGVTNIGEWAFSGCVGLTSITIPNTVKSIEKNAFKRCSGLTSINIPNSVTNIGYGVFSDCNGLASVTLPNSVSSIGAHAFSGCEVLTSITIPQNVIDIMPWTFATCRGLTSVTISDGVTHIGDYVFYGCSNLTSVVIPNSVTNIGDHAFEGCSGLTSITISNSVTRIGDEAFRSCTGLTSVTIPNSVTNIGYGAFSGCNGLTSAIIQNPNLQSQYDYVFIGCDKLQQSSKDDPNKTPQNTNKSSKSTSSNPKEVGAKEEYRNDENPPYPNGDYTDNYRSFINVDMRHERSMGLDVYVENISGRHIKEITISFTAEGHTEKLFVSGLKPNETQNKLFQYMGDGYPYISKVEIIW